MYRLIDTHAHLDEIVGLDEALVEAKSAGITAIVSMGTDYKSNQEVLRLARVYEGLVYPALGLHPSSIAGSDIARTLEFIEANIDLAVAIGEVGLDYHKKVRLKAEKDLQKDVLRELLGIARKYDKPVSIHTRYAWRDAFDLVAESGVKRVVFHWYTGTSSVLEDIIRQGYFISATPAVEYHEEHRRAVRDIPLERLLLETDSPVVYGRGREFEYESRPIDVVRVLRYVAELRKMSESRMASITTANALRFFKLFTAKS